jgi:hypothetical protein
MCSSGAGTERTKKVAGGQTVAFPGVCRDRIQLPSGWSWLAAHARRDISRPVRWPFQRASPLGTSRVACKSTDGTEAALCRRKPPVRPKHIRSRIVYARESSCVCCWHCLLACQPRRKLPRIIHILQGLNHFWNNASKERHYYALQGGNMAQQNCTITLLY